MPIPVVCPSCNSQVRLPDNAAGKRFRCPKCQGAIPGPAASAAKQSVIRPHDQTDTGFVDSPADPAESKPFEGPAPISSLARKAVQPDFNPFDDGTAGEQDDEKPRGKRYYKPKDDYNPFSESAATGPAMGAGEPGQLFDFGAAEPGQPVGDGEFNFGSEDQSENNGRRRRRR
jgi:hypothetical protein